MTNAEKLLKAVEENELGIFHYSKNGLCCVIGHAFNIIDEEIISKQLIEAENYITINELPNKLDLLKENFPEFKGSWYRLQIINDSENKDKVIEYLKANI